MPASEAKQKKKLSRRDRGLRYPVEYVASELGVDRKTLERRCESSGFHLNGAGLTFREAYTSLSEKFQAEQTRRRKEAAEAEIAEIEAANKRKELVFMVDHKNIIQDFGTKLRVQILKAPYLSNESKKKLAKDIAEIKPTAAALS